MRAMGKRPSLHEPIQQQAMLLVRTKIIHRKVLAIVKEDRDHPIFDWERTSLVFGNVRFLCNRYSLSHVSVTPCEESSFRSSQVDGRGLRDGLRA